MPNYDELYASKSDYLKAKEFPTGQKAKLVIAGHQEVKFGEDSTPRCALQFEDKEKGVVLNAGNYNRLKQGYGDDCDAWIGKTVFLSTEIIPSGQYAGDPMFRVEPELAEMTDDDIPF